MNKPKTFRMFDRNLPNLEASKRIASAPRWFTGGECVILSDNRLIEISTDTRGCFIYAIWNSAEDFYSYKSGVSEKIRLEQF